MYEIGKHTAMAIESILVECDVFFFSFLIGIVYAVIDVSCDWHLVLYVFRLPIRVRNRFQMTGLVDMRCVS